jgi:hypothetical protein
MFWSKQNTSLYCHQCVIASSSHLPYRCQQSHPILSYNSTWCQNPKVQFDCIEGAGEQNFIVLDSVWHLGVIHLEDSQTQNTDRTGMLALVHSVGCWLWEGSTPLLIKETDATFLCTLLTHIPLWDSMSRPHRRLHKTQWFDRFCSHPRRMKHRKIVFLYLLKYGFFGNYPLQWVPEFNPQYHRKEKEKLLITALICKS